MKKLLLAAALAFSAAVPAFAEITATDVVGRTVTVPKVPERIVLGFYYEDYLAIGGKDAVDKVVALALSTWKDWRPQQYARYEKALPKLKDIPDIGNTEDGTFSVEKIIATNPDLVILGAWNYEALANRSNNSMKRAFLTSSSITTRKPSKNTRFPRSPWANYSVRSNARRSSPTITKMPLPILKSASRN